MTQQAKSKLKILFVTEASFLSSGFANYTRELLNRLYKTNKYHIAEFASYGLVNDPRDKDIPWRYYANAVNENDPRYQEYTSRTDNQFGRWRFEKVLLDFKPDIVCDIRDYWMSSYQALSPLRKYFHWILMPTVDSAPQQEEWIDTFLSADSILTYSDWGANVLKEQSSGKINYIDTVSPGVDLDIFKPIADKSGLKNKLGIPQDSIVIGSVMRNQKRKLFPELMASFRSCLDKLDQTNPKLSSKLYLYLHTSYPDAGWDIPELLKINRLSNKVLFSYSCRSCSCLTSTVYSGPIKVCPSCLNKTMVLPSVTAGISNDRLAEVYNIFDLYVQYSICEGFGLPQVEAGACGVPIVTVNYSAMVDVVNKLEAIPIQPKTYFKELETKAIRVYPDNEQLANEIIKFLSQPQESINKQKIRVRELTEKHYHWDDITKKWENHLDYLDKTYRSNWSKPAKFLQPIKTKENLDPSQNWDYIKHICQNNLDESSMIGSMNILTILQQADYGFSVHGAQITKHDYKDIEAFTNTLISNWNNSEQVRAQNVKFDDDFIRYANIKDQTS